MLNWHRCSFNRSSTQDRVKVQLFTCSRSGGRFGPRYIASCQPYLACSKTLRHGSDSPTPIELHRHDSLIFAVPDELLPVRSYCGSPYAHLLQRSRCIRSGRPERRIQAVPLLHVPARGNPSSNAPLGELELTGRSFRRMYRRSVGEWVSTLSKLRRRTVVRLKRGPNHLPSLRADRETQIVMVNAEGTTSRPPSTVRCENPKCGKSILLDESLLAPDADTPQGHIHTSYNPKVSSFSALCRDCHHFTVNISQPGQSPISRMNAPPS